uniref:Uncharacterized protein n=1 Tax=Glossina pallidipes TaxID=7398 RepID=A0A1A9ZC10_GLOPL
MDRSVIFLMSSIDDSRRTKGYGNGKEGKYIQSLFKQDLLGEAGKGMCWFRICEYMYEHQYSQLREYIEKFLSSFYSSTACNSTDFAVYRERGGNSSYVRANKQMWTWTQFSLLHYYYYYTTTATTTTTTTTTATTTTTFTTTTIIITMKVDGGPGQRLDIYYMDYVNESDKYKMHCSSETPEQLGRGVRSQRAQFMPSRLTVTFLAHTEQRPSLAYNCQLSKLLKNLNPLCFLHISSKRSVENEKNIVTVSQRTDEGYIDGR